MDISHEDFQKAKRISRAIQEYLESINQDGLRSTDIYPILARKGLIEKDRNNGLHLRKFLKKLKESNMLKSLIPQCEFRTTKTEFLEWYFYRSKVDSSITISYSAERKKLIAPEISEDEINELIEKTRHHVSKLPKSDSSVFTPQMIEIRNNYPRAFKNWTEREIEIMLRAYNKFKRIDKVAELLQRQPSVIKKRIDNYK